MHLKVCRCHGHSLADHGIDRCAGKPMDGAPTIQTAPTTTSALAHSYGSGVSDLCPGIDPGCTSPSCSVAPWTQRSFTQQLCWAGPNHLGHPGASPLLGDWQTGAKYHPRSDQSGCCWTCNSDHPSPEQNQFGWVGHHLSGAHRRTRPGCSGDPEGSGRRPIHADRLPLSRR